jgi:hypothetical protein
MPACARCGEVLHDEAAQCPTCGLVVPGQLSSIEPAQEPWTIVATSGPLVLGQSEQQFAVYDAQRTYGRWPRTDEGYRYAWEAYNAHSQSLMHGAAYTATGYQDPERLGLPTEPILKPKTYSAPLSYIGSFRRIVPWASKLAKRSPLYAAFGWTVAVISLLIVWVFVTFWYFFVFGLFGIFVIPYRLLRRSSRKTQHIQATALATQQAMLQQQQVLLQQIAQQQLLTGPSTPQVSPAAVPRPPSELPPPAAP